MLRRLATFGLSIALFFSLAAADEPANTAEQILRSYVEDFRQDPAAAEPITFGVRVTGEGGGDWHVVVAGSKKDDDAFQVNLKPSLPPEPAVYYTLDLAMLRKLDAGQMNALTAMANAPAPMGLEFMPGYEPDADLLQRFIPFTFHFWTRGLPERVPFDGAMSRQAHGVNAVVFYYQKGLRSGWLQIEKGQHCNRDPADQANPFPSMFIMIRGEAEARIGGREVTFAAREMMFVPPGVTHEFWNPNEEPAEMIILMFGEGA
jgi:mannose-6-phosphate isomerase-like protein (cupin superfamily)